MNNIIIILAILTTLIYFLYKIKIIQIENSEEVIDANDTDAVIDYNRNATNKNDFYEKYRMNLTSFYNTMFDSNKLISIRRMG